MPMVIHFYVQDPKNNNLAVFHQVKNFVWESPGHQPPEISVIQGLTGRFFFEKPDGLAE
jgi:hypothetical protein